MDFVVNEWLPEYFKPSASPQEKLQLQTFLNRFWEKKDRIIVKRPSPFLEKIYRCAKAYQEVPEIVEPLRSFIKLLLENSKKCVFIDDVEMNPLPEAVRALLSQPDTNYSSDTYLFESASAMPEKRIIVTTDAKLANQFKDEPWCKVVLLSDFLADY